MNKDKDMAFFFRSWMNYREEGKTTQEDALWHAWQAAWKLSSDLQREKDAQIAKHYEMAHPLTGSDIARRIMGENRKWWGDLCGNKD